MVNMLACQAKNVGSIPTVCSQIRFVKRIKMGHGRETRHGRR